MRTHHLQDKWCGSGAMPAVWQACDLTQSRLLQWNDAISEVVCGFLLVMGVLLLINNSRDAQSRLLSGTTETCSPDHQEMPV